MGTREDFEKWASQPPYEFNLDRFTENGSWPGNYRGYPVQCAWEAWQAATLQAAERMKEEAAKVCDEKHWDDNRLFADAIRAIGVKEIFK